MAYALSYPNAPTEAQVQAEAAAPKGFLARLLASIERTQMARFRRELQLYSPHLYESLIVHGEHAKIAQSDDYKLPFVK
jgi:hypothetical protein